MLKPKSITRKFIFSAALILCLAGLNACSRVKEELGLTRHTPDEFMVMKRAPLEIPVDLSALPPPTPGLQRPQETNAVTQAKVAVLGDPRGDVLASQSNGERALIQKSGAGQSNDQIRQIVNQEATTENKDKRPVIKRLLSWGEGTPSATVVDPVKESERIQSNLKAGQTVTNGATPMVND